MADMFLYAIWLRSFYLGMVVQRTYPMNHYSHELFSLQIDWKLAVYQHGNLNFILTAFECHIYLKWCWRWWSNWNCINQLSINCRRYTLATGGIPRVANILKNINKSPNESKLKIHTFSLNWPSFKTEKLE